VQRRLGNGRDFTVAALLAAASAWPSLLCAFAGALRSPYEQALSSAWCGAAPRTAFQILGHCPACWSGALALALAAALTAFGHRNKFASVRQ
jgi:hypothetical protein